MAVVQKAIAPRMLLFMLEPEARSANPFGAFVNRNHFAAWLLLVGGAGRRLLIARLRIHPTIGRGCRRDHRAVPELGRAVHGHRALIVTIGTLLLTLSRSAVAGLGAAAVTAGGSAGRACRSSGPACRRRSASVGAVLLVVVLFVDLDGWATRLEQSFGTGGGAVQPR